MIIQCRQGGAKSRLQSLSDELLPEFLASWMRLHLVHEWFSKTSQQTTGLGNYSWGAVKKLPLRFPSEIAEQRRIAAALKLAGDAIVKAKAEGSCFLNSASRDDSLN